MKSSILRFGGFGALFGGLIFIGTHFFVWIVDLDILELFGWISILTSLIFIFFVIKHYQDYLNNGVISLGRALIIGLAISAIAGLAIGLMDVIYVSVINTDFVNQYVNHTLEGLKDSLEREEFVKREAEILEEMKLYDNPAFSGLFMFGLVFSIGIIISLISSLILQHSQN